MSFAVIISEKGGQERREVFDKQEITVGRVQGNDLLLPKGNVSKRHARIVYRDGRFIVTDLKSTNGSYVNGHRIAQATIVREGDKIYIGDFILKVEPLSSPSLAPVAPDRRPADLDASAGHASDGAIATPPPRQSFGQPDPSSLSHIPLEQDPDDPSVTGMPAVGAPRAATLGVETRPPRQPQPGVMGASRQPAPAHPSIAAPPPPPPRPVAPPPTAGAPPPVPARAVRTHEPGFARSGQAMALSLLASRLSDVVELDEGDSFAPVSDGKRTTIDRVLREQARSLQQEGEFPPGASLEDLVRDATREALGAGPLDALLDDDEVVEVQISRFDQLVVHRENAPPAPAEHVFSSERALRRALGRLAYGAGVRLREGDATLDLRLAGGAQLTAILAPVASNGSVATLRKRRRADLGLEDLVRTQTLSRPMATFLQQCLLAKSNILIAGPLGSGTTTLLGALAGAIPTEERVFALQDLDELILAHPYGASFLVPDTGEAGARVVRAAAHLRPDRLLVGAMAGEIVGQVMEAIGGGADGVLAAIRGPTLRQALARLVPSLCAASPGLDAGTARAWIAASFGVVVEVARWKGGRHRVLRISELVADAAELQVRDVFEFVLDPAGAERGEGAFHATGVVPTVAQDLKAMGHRVDETAFRRLPR